MALHNAIFLFLSFALAMGNEAWSPSDSVLALDSAIQAVNKVASLPHLSPEDSRRAKEIAQNVTRDIDDAERGNITKAEAREKVQAAIQLLDSFSKVLVGGRGSSAPAGLSVSLAKKRAELAKAQETVKLLNLQKKLAAKRLALQAMLAERAALSSAAKVHPHEVTREAVIERLVNATKHLRGNASSSESDQKAKEELQETLDWVAVREHNVSEDIKAMKVQENWTDLLFDRAARAHRELEEAEEPEVPTNSSNSTEVPTNSSNSTTGQGANHTNQSVPTKEENPLAEMGNLMKSFQIKAHRQFSRVAVYKKAELKELQDAEASIKRRDADGLQKVISKMRAETKQRKIQSGEFLH